LCGENGAGKSTLMNFPKDSQDAGIGFVHQELCLCPHLSAAENIFLTLKSFISAAKLLLV